MRPEDGLQPAKLEVHHDLTNLFALLPAEMTELLEKYEEDLLEIVLDYGERPFFWAAGKRIPLTEDARLVSRQDLDRITNQLGRFGSDNRAGLEKQLHRISAIRNS